MKKKLAVIFYCCLFCCLHVFAQPQNTGTAKVQADADKSKTGQSQDVLADYLQVVAKNISSTDKSVQLKLNWFALNGLDSAKKYNDDYFLKSRWQRNGQFLFGAGIGTANKFNSATGGITYNFLNRRDTSMHDYSSVYATSMALIDKIEGEVEKENLPELQSLVRTKVTSIINDLLKKGDLVDNLQELLTQTFVNYKLEGQGTGIIKSLQEEINQKIKSGEKIEQKSSTFKDYVIEEISKKSVYDALHQYKTTKGKQFPTYDNYITEKYFKGLVAELNKKIKADPTLQKTTGAADLIDLDAKLNQKYEDAIAYVARQPLITGSYNGTYGTGTTLSSHVFAAQLLWGLAKLGSQKSTQFTGTVSDTLTGKDPTGKLRGLDRNLLTVQAGVNFVLAKVKKASVMEVNIGAENDFVTEGAIKNQWNVFMFDSYFRARLPNTPWLKLDIKYSPQNHNVLGFLNFTYNIDK